MLPNKERQTRQRRRTLAKVDRLISQLRRDAKTFAKELGATKNVPLIAQTVVPETKVEVQKPSEPGVDIENAKHQVTLLKERLRLPPEKKVTRSYLEYACIYNGIKLTTAQRNAIELIYRDNETF